MEKLVDRIIRNKNKLLVMGGILHASDAFLGPEVLHLDLTNHCNFNCIACWCRSPLLGERAMPDWEKKLSLPLDTIKSIFDDISEMGGLRQVKLVGGGEPFMHPDILTIAEYIKRVDRKIEIDINTNFSLVDKRVAERLLELEVDSFTVSLWAGTPEAYSAVHPNQGEDTFYKIKDTLQFIFEQKKKNSSFRPRIIFHNVVFKLNYRDVEEMLQFALDVGANDIQFVPVDPVKGKTEILLLNDGEKRELLDKLYVMRERYNPESFQYTSEDNKSIILSDFNGFIRRIEELNIESGAYDEEVVDEVPCYVGWLFARVMATGNVVPCCKGHRMTMGNVHQSRFKGIWRSETYNVFRKNGITISKCHPYFSKIGNDAGIKTGCYNCDNLWQNVPTHREVTMLKNKYPQLVSFNEALLKHLF